MDLGTPKFARRTVAALIATLLVAGCAKDKAKEEAPAPAANPAEAPAMPAALEEKPGAAEAELLVLNAKVTHIDKKKRIVTLKYEDGRTAKVKCGPEVRNFPQIRVGDDVTAEFLESMELFVTGPGVAPDAETTTVAERAPKGAKPAMTAAKSTELIATVEDINYDTREVTLKGPQGKLFKVKAGSEVKRLNEVHKGDSVVARYTEAMSIKVTTPKKK